MFIQFILSIPMIILVVFFPTLTHPLSMGLSILMLTLLLAISLGVLTTSFWMSYILILVLLGGLLVIFIYVSLLASNELFSKKNSVGIAVLSLISISLTLIFSNFSWVTKESSLTPLKFFNTKGLEWMTSLYSQNLSGVTMFLVLYLLLTLIVVVNITKSDYSSLRAQ